MDTAGAQDTQKKDGERSIVVGVDSSFEGTPNKEGLIVTGEGVDLLSLSLPIPKPVKHRPTFNEDQITAMERVFTQRQYLSPMERESLASSVGLSPQQVRVWFQNRRQKVKQFLSQRQVRNGQSSTATQNGDKEDTGGSLSAQQLTNNIDPILQMLLPKTTSGENGEEGQGKRDGTEVPVAMITLNETSKEEQTGSQPAPSQITPPETTPSQISLTPYILPLSTANLPTIQLSGGGANITIPAIQLLQSLLSVSSSLPVNKLTKSPMQTSRGGPLKAQSPAKVCELNEEMEIKEEDARSTTLSSSNLPSIDSNKPVADEPQQSSDNNNQVLNANNEILQQLLGLTATPGGDGLKTTWNLSVSPSSLAAAMTGASPSSTGSTPKRKRQVFSGVQTTELEKHFETSAYIDSKEREKLAERIGLHPDQVKVWFQNRRTKKSRQSWRQQKDTSSSTANTTPLQGQ